MMVFAALGAAWEATLMKFLIKAILVIVLLVVIGVAAALFFVDRLARNGVEQGATYALGVPTTLRAADVRIMAGEFTMGGLNVANPEGFTTPHFMTLNDGEVAVTLASLREDVVELPRLELTGIDVNLEKKGGKSNYNVILENLKRFEEKDPPPDQQAGKKFMIRQVVVRDVTAHVDVLPVGGELTRLELPIDEITLEDVGSDTDGGMLMSELSGTIIKAIFAGILKKGGDLLPDDLLNDLGGALEDLGGIGQFGVEVAGQALGEIGKGAGEVLEGVGNVGGEVGKGAGEALKGVGEGLGGLLGGDKDEEDDGNN